MVCECWNPILTFCTICKFLFLCLFFFFFLLKLGRAWLNMSEFSIICRVQQVAWDKHFTGNNLAEDPKSPVSAAILKICNVHSIIHNTEAAFIRAADLSLKLLYRFCCGDCQTYCLCLLCFAFIPRRGCVLTVLGSAGTLCMGCCLLSYPTAG